MVIISKLLNLITKCFRNQLGVVVALGCVELGDVEVDGAVGLVSVAALDDLLNEGHVFRDVLADTRQAIGRKDLRKSRKTVKP